MFWSAQISYGCDQAWNLKPKQNNNKKNNKPSAKFVVWLFDLQYICIQQYVFIHLCIHLKSKKKKEK